MNNKLKTLTLITTGLVVGVVIGRVGKRNDIYKLDGREFAKHLAKDSLSKHLQGEPKIMNPY
ncbi:hypothetical protein HYO62_00275 [Aerococcaceae bacterium DSM 111022]|nr:hypothetical protein [Aerococcaceae bacterium DSM 111022]